MLTKWAVRYLCWQLRKDEGFWMAYQANIAMSIYDSLVDHKVRILGGRAQLKRVCGMGANNFLRLWTKRR